MIGVKNIEMKRYYLFGTKACETLMDSYERLYMDIKHGAIDGYHLMEFDPLTDNPTDLLYLVRYKWSDYTEITEAQYNKLDRL